MASPLPVIVCGRTEQVARAVIEGLKPEIEVIHIIFSVPSGRTQIPALLRGDKDVQVPSDNPDLGTKNYAQPPAAIILGAGYDDAMTEQLRSAAKDQGTKDVPWLRADLSIPTPPIGPEYGAAMVRRVKEKLLELRERGEVGMDGDGVVWY